MVVAAAMRVLDKEGLDRLSLRRVAQELGVAAPALYWHFRDKQELLDHMVQAVATDIGQWHEPLPGQPWHDWLADRARRMRREMLAHRDSARLAAGTRPTPTLVPLIEGRIQALTQAGFTPGQALRTVLVVSNYVAGFVLDEQAEAAREADDGDVRVAEAKAMFRTQISTGSLPYLKAAFAEIGDPNDEAGFEFGLNLILDGLHAQLARNQLAGHLDPLLDPPPEALG